MKILKKCLILLTIVLLNACSIKDDVKFALFFNSSHVFHIKGQTFYAELGKKTIVDTIIESTNVDKSVLLKCFEINGKNRENLYIRVNNQDTLIRLNDYKKCSSIFVSYDDHTNESRRQVLDDIGRISSDSTRNVLIDSLNLERRNVDFLEVNVRQDSCWCNE